VTDIDEVVWSVPFMGFVLDELANGLVYLAKK